MHLIVWARTRTAKKFLHFLRWSFRFSIKSLKTKWRWFFSVQAWKSCRCALVWKRVYTCLNYGAELFALQMNFIELQLHYLKIVVELRCFTWITAKLRLHYLHCGWIAAPLQCEFLHCSQRNLKNSHFDRFD
jgi:hypothetical protein